MQKYFKKVCKRLKEKEYILSSYDLVGEGKIRWMFPICSHFLENSLSDEADIAISEKGIKWRKKTYPIIRSLTPLFMSHKQVIEDRYELQKLNTDERDCGISIPDRPVIYASNHGFYDDGAATISIAKRPAYVVTDGISELYNTFDGIALWVLGLILLNNKIKKNRNAVIKKAVKVLNCGTDVIIFPEGVWNKTPNLLVLPLHRGIYRIAKEAGLQVVPVIHFIADPIHVSPDNPIHTVIDDPISFDNMSEEEALVCLRDKFAYWYWLMSEKYATCKREDIVGRCKNSSDIWEQFVKELISADHFYDVQLSRNADYRPKDIVRPEEAFRAISNIKNINAENIKMVIEAEKIVREQKDFQRLF